MGNLYDAKIKIDKIIEEKKLDPFQIKGAIGLKAGLLVGFLRPDTPDDTTTLEQLRRAVKEILNESI